MDAVTLYDEDFYAWSEQQAAVLRGLSRGPALPNELDLEHVAEEVEDLGKAELRTVCSMLRQLFIHLVKVKAMPLHQAVPHWKNEVDTFRDQASDHYSRSMAQHIELETIWRRAAGLVGATLEREDADAETRAVVAKLSTMGCPFEVGDLFEGAPLAERLIGIVDAAVGAPDV